MVWHSKVHLRHYAKSVAIGRTVAEMWRFIDLFSNDILYACLNQHGEYFVVFITVQKFAGIDAVVSITCKFYYFAS